MTFWVIIAAIIAFFGFVILGLSALYFIWYLLEQVLERD